MARQKRSTTKLQQQRRKAILEARTVVAELTEQNANEAETRRRVERIFESVMGFDPFEHLTREHAVSGAAETEHVDFAIRLEAGNRSRPVILVELKRVGADLARKHLKQVSSYAINTGCEWLLLTNARQWSLYHVTFGQPPETTLISEWDLLEDDVAELLDRFELICLSSIRRGILDELWQKRKVLDSRNVLQAIFGDKSMALLRRELRKSTDLSLTIEDVLGGVRHLLNENAAATMEELAIRFPVRKRRRSSGTKPRREKQTTAPSKSGELLDLIQRGVLKPPLRLFADYKDQKFEATLQADGSITFENQKYSSASKAASAARAKVLGREASTNGWEFWCFTDCDGNAQTLGTARSSRQGLATCRLRRLQ